MFRIDDCDISKIIHDLIKITANLKTVHEESLTDNDKVVLHNCEKRLMQIRQEIIEAMEEDNDE